MRRYYFLWFFVIFLSLLSGCKKDSVIDDVKPDADKYLASYTLVKTILNNDILLQLSFAQFIYPTAALVIPKAKADVKIYKITYKTLLGKKEVIASGLVGVPTGSTTCPLLSFQNGTNTVYANAPSKNVADQSIQLLASVSSTGFLLVIPDYIGFGSSEETFHPYLHAESTISSVVDMLRAVKEMSKKSDTGMKISNDLYLMGYSQGGWSTLQVHKAIETTYSSEFNLKAVGCGAGPYDLTLINNTILNQSTFLQPYYIAYMIKGYKSIGLVSNPYSDVFNEPYASRIDPLFNGINDGSTINSQLTTSVNQLFTQEYRTTFSTNTKYKEIRDVLIANSIGAWKVKTPLTLIHGTADQDVTPLTTQQLYQSMMLLDPALPVTYIQLNGMTHGTASIPALLEFVKKFLEIKG